MKRRQFLRTAGFAAAGSTLAAPAIAQAAPQINWKLTSSFPPALETLSAGARHFADAAREASDGRINIEVHPPGEIAGAVDALDAVKEGRADCAQTALHYWWGTEPALVFATGAPFGMNAREHAGFMHHGGGAELINETLASHNIVALLAGNTGCEMGGWFRNEVKSVSDLKGMKFRISGIAGKILQRLGVEPTAVARGDIAASLQSGALDAAAWVSPVDDEKLELAKVAPHYYYPGWQQPSLAVHIAINAARWNELSKAHQAILRQSAEFANARMLSTYDSMNPPAVRRLVENGARLKSFPADVMEALWRAADDVYAETARDNANFLRVHSAYMAARNEQYLWWQVAEYPYDNFVIRQRAKG